MVVAVMSMNRTGPAEQQSLVLSLPLIVSLNYFACFCFSRFVYAVVIVDLGNLKKTWYSNVNPFGQTAQYFVTPDCCFSTYLFL